MVLPGLLGGRVGRCQTQKLDGGTQPIAEVVKLVDTLDSKSSALRRAGSIPALSTNYPQEFIFPGILFLYLFKININQAFCNNVSNFK